MYYKLFSIISYLVLYLIQPNFLAATLPYNNYTQIYILFLIFCSLFRFTLLCLFFVYVFVLFFISVFVFFFIRLVRLVIMFYS